MRVAVVGATGNLGSAVVRRLARDPAVSGIVGVARRRPTSPLELADGGEVEWRTADVRVAPWSSVLADIDAVVHLAWMFQPARDPDVTWGTNVTALARLLDALPDTGVTHLLVASSVAAYSPSESSAAVDETWSTHGASSAAYAREKAYVERLLDSAERSGLTITRLRPAFVFQRSAASEQRRIFGGRLVPQRLVRPATVPVLPVPAGLRLQTVHADDVADAAARAVGARAPGSFNLCADEVLSPRDLAAVFEARPVEVPVGLVRTGVAAGWRSRALPVPPELFDALLRVPVMSNRRARQELGWEPAHTASGTLAELVTGLAEGGGGATEPLAPA